MEFDNACVLMQEMRRDVGQLQSALIQKLSILDRYEHILSQVNAVAMQKLVDPQTQVQYNSIFPITTLQLHIY